ncbi:IS3 family transposase [Flavobacterium sp. GT2N3]|uniref:IS3 family transposase n=1 Tax=unclassified Flavobacterium TaxID=196869 RepID=UPI003AAD81D9
MKTELIYGNKLISNEQMKLEILEYIEIWYNRKRRHSVLDSFSTVSFKLYWNREFVQSNRLILSFSSCTI